MPLSSGTRLGPYEIVAPLGAGGMGEVYQARDRRLERDVALKILAPLLSESPRARERFSREARAVAALSHPNICTIHDVSEGDDGQAFLVMELLQGETLQQRIVRGPLDAAVIADVGIALADALAAAHAVGIVHRDLKPANVFLTAHGPKILDFGLATTSSLEAAGGSEQPTIWRGAHVTASGDLVGTLSYMSPEQLRGDELDARTDLYSLGLVLYEMATGRPAFAGATSAVIASAILHDQPAPPRQLRHDLPEALERVILKACEKDRALRYQHASELRADLLRLKRDGTSSDDPIAMSAARRRRAPSLWTIAVPAVAVVALVLAGAYRYFQRAPVLTDKDTLVIADFRNTTGDDLFDETLRRGLSVQLEQSPFLSIISDDRIKRTLALMGRPVNTRLAPEVAKEICERTGSAAVLEGSIAPLGTQYVLGLRATHCRTGDTLDQEQVQAARKEDVLNALSQIAKTFRTRVGESLATVEKHSTPLEEATTSSLEALKAFSAAWKVTVTSGTVASVPLYKRATEIDPQFAIALAHLGLGYNAQGEVALAAETTSRAYQLRNRASDPERFFIATIYDRQVTGNLEREVQTLTLWTQTYPRDPTPHGLLGAFASIATGRYELCLDEAPKMMALDPDIIFSYINPVVCNLFLERHDEAERLWQRAAGRFGATHNVSVLGYHLAFLTGDRERMDRQAALVRKGPGGEETMAHMEALVLAREGRLDAAASSARRAVDIAERAGLREAASTYEAAAAAWMGFFGDPAAARRRAAAALRLSRGRDAEYAAAVALALAGDVAAAEPLAADLEKRYPEDTSVQSSYLPTLYALLALDAGDPARAIERLEAARTYELADPAIHFGAYFGSMYPVYVRGEAYLAAHRNTEAAAEFRKILDHRGLVLADPMGARARLELGRASAAADDTAKARAAYADFLALWKDADPDVPILRQARDEYAGLARRR